MCAVIAAACSKADKLRQETYIKIYVNNGWRITITDSGIVSFMSMIDAHPLSGAITKTETINYKDMVTAIKAYDATLTIEKNERPRSSWAVIPGETKKIAVSEEILYKILSQASKKWEFPSPSKRFLELLDRKPLLENLKLQNKALRPTGGGVTPKKEP